jgi:hypothetical protein
MTAVDAVGIVLLVLFALALITLAGLMLVILWRWRDRW